MERETGEVLEYVLQVEELAEDVLTDRQHIIDLDRKRQQTRQAIRALQKDKSSEKTWVCFGNMFLKMPKPKANVLLQKDFDKLDQEISETQKNLKPKVNKLRDLENKEEIKGFSLQPLSKEEMSALQDVL